MTTESRRLSPEDAAANVTAACQGLAPGQVFKKIDSTLRGHVAVETAAAARAVEATGMLVCPAFPAMGRTVVDGTLCVEGEPLARVVDHVPTGALVVDAADDADLDRVVAGAMSGVLLVGSGGPGRGAGPGGQAGDPGAPPPPRPGTVVVVAGSDHEVTREQAGLVDGCTLVVPPPKPAGDPLHVARRLAGEAVRGWPDPVAGLVLSGGESAAAVLDALGACAVDLTGELEPGVPLGRIVGGRADGLPVVLKAGGFGDRGTLAPGGRVAPAVRPVLALTVGDVAGVGPEVVAGALADPRVHGSCRPLVVGDAASVAPVVPGAAGGRPRGGGLRAGDGRRAPTRAATSSRCRSGA